MTCVSADVSCIFSGLILMKRLRIRLSAWLLSFTTVAISAQVLSGSPERSNGESPAQLVPWAPQNSTTHAGLRGIHAVGGGVAWASGTNGTVLRTEDGGYMWQSCAMPPGAERLDFRGVWAWDADTAVVMSSGPGGLSRLYKTTDGCSSWKLLYTNPDKDGFWDAVQFWDEDHGLVIGDPVLDSRFGSPVTDFAIFETTDGGDNWRRVGDRFPVPDQAIFAASNSSLVVEHDRARFGSGGKRGAFIYDGLFVKSDCANCQAASTLEFGIRPAVSLPLASGTDSSGVFSLAFRDQKHGIAVGGDYKKPNESIGTAAFTSDGGKTWSAAARPPHGYRSAVAWDAADKAWIAAGTNGSDVSYDGGKTWVLSIPETGMPSASRGWLARMGA